MNQQEIIEFNRKCAEFLGFKKSDFYHVNKTLYYIKDTDCPVKFHGRDDTLQFHSDWNWIMEVVGKIQSLDIVHDNTRSYDSVFKEWQCTFSPSYKTHDFDYIAGRSKTLEKEAVVEAINQFLTWHNANK